MNAAERCPDVRVINTVTSLCLPATTAAAVKRIKVEVLADSHCYVTYYFDTVLFDVVVVLFF